MKVFKDGFTPDDIKQGDIGWKWREGKQGERGGAGESGMMGWEGSMFVCVFTRMCYIVLWVFVCVCVSLFVWCVCLCAYV